MAVKIYRQVGKGKNRRYQRVNVGPGRRPSDLAGPYFLRYSQPDGSRPWELVGNNLDEAIEAQKRKQAYFDALKADVPVAQEDAGRLGRKLRMQFSRGYPSFSSSGAKTSRAKATRPSARTLIGWASFSTSPSSAGCFSSSFMAANSAFSS